MVIRTYRYVPHYLLPDYLSLGWLVIADLGDYHGQFSVLCEWRCGCRCVEPIKP